MFVSRLNSFLSNVTTRLYKEGIIMNKALRSTGNKIMIYIIT